jgi:hypothetical protein
MCGGIWPTTDAKSNVRWLHRRLQLAVRPFRLIRPGGLRAATQEAVKFMNHSKRSTLTTDDINAGLQLRNVEVRVAHVSRLPPPNS